MRKCSRKRRISVLPKLIRTSDVEGLDAARKMAILARLGFSMNVDLEDVKVKGDLPNYRRGHQLQQTPRLYNEADRDCSA
jgi:homoserine dehydrogenase